jgi:hypothetical protein
VGSRFEMGASIANLIEELKEVQMPEPDPYTGTELAKQKIYEIKLIQFIKDQAKLENEIKRLYSLVLGQFTDYMISKLKDLPIYCEMHEQEDTLKLLKSIKSLTFMSGNNKEYKMNLVKADDKFHKIYQLKDMPNIEFFKIFNNLVEGIEHGRIALGGSYSNP